MVDLSTFEQYYKLADMLIGKATKEQVAECGRLLALNLAHYQAIHGEIPLENTLAMVDLAEPNEAQVKLLTDGMQNFVGVLGTVCSVLGETRH
jgi:hypothetical protein